MVVRYNLSFTHFVLFKYCIVYALADFYGTSFN
ncbi:hypothetical protein EB54_02752 [Enterococcus gallinarum]|nr:hypothetical protein EB54_02752 [Enterococcus gallinarum]